MSDVSITQEFRLHYIAILIQPIPPFLINRLLLYGDPRDPSIAMLGAQLRWFRVVALQQLIGGFGLYGRLFRYLTTVGIFVI